MHQIFNFLQCTKTMPFFGSDWRAPGDKWIRTELGWKRLSDIHTNFQLQLTRVAAALPSKRRNSRLRSHSGSPRNSSRASSRTTSPLSEQKCFDEHRLHVLQFALAQRCVSARTSSREDSAKYINLSPQSSHYATISDAFNKLNFSQALLDTNCFPFICKVVGILFETQYWTLSGSMQTSLLRLTDAAKDIALESRIHTGLILRLIDKERDILEKGRSMMMTGFSISRLDTKVKTLINYRAQLIGELHRADGETLPQLPDDCWRHVITYLTDPRDVLNLRSVNWLPCIQLITSLAKELDIYHLIFRFLCGSKHKLHTVASEDSVWRNLSKYHYGTVNCGPNVLAISDSQSVSAMNVFKEMYISSGKQLKSLESHAVLLCQLCHSVYWRDYGHPCSAAGPQAGSTELQSTQLTNTSTGLTAHQFVHLF